MSTMSGGGSRPNKRRRLYDPQVLLSPPNSQPYTPPQESVPDSAGEGYVSNLNQDAVREPHTPSPCEDLNTETPSRGRESTEESDQYCKEVACFGMIKDIVVDIQPSQRSKAGARLPVTLIEPDILMQNGADLPFAKVPQRPAAILRNLKAQCDLQLFCQPKVQIAKGGHGAGGREGKKQTKAGIMLCVNIYAPCDMAEVVGEFLTDCGMHLQDPVHCDRDVVYCNPHLLCNDEEPVTTLSLALPSTIPDIEQLGTKPDLFELLRNEQPLLETETPAILSTQLYSHQKQALTFMLRREAGWNLDGEDKDIWERGIDDTGRVIYTNTVTGFRQHAPPPDFRGGLLADQMGLGKSLSIVALIAANPAGDLTQAFDKAEGYLTPVKTTLLIVPSPLLQSWKDQLTTHMKPGTITSYVYHGKQKRKVALEGHFDVVITTFKTLAMQWERSQITSQHSTTGSLFSVLWHRVILDEAHVIQNRKTSIAKACCTVNATHRWALTGTPIQNRLTDLASIFEFLKVYPFCDSLIFDSEITKPWLSGDQQGVLRLKTLVNYVTLCRTKSVISLPKRVDQVHHLDFSTAEQDVYDAAKIRTADMLNDAIASGSTRRGLYLNALQWLNTLRLICNHGVLESRRGQTRLAKEDLAEEQWNESVAQAAFQDMVCAGAAICSNCTTNLPDSFSENPSLEGTELARPRLFACLQLLCDTCFHEKSKDISCPVCPSALRCSEFAVSLTEDATTPSQVTTPSGNVSDAEIPIKLKALVKDLESTKDAKSVVFSSWTLTLDLVERALDCACITHTRLDGKMSGGKRTSAMLQFQQDPNIQVILVSLTCGGTGLNLTSASRAYLLEPQWNPMIEEQAMCRIYRIGQKKPVTTIRYRIRDSFEENVVAIQDRKKDLASLTFSKDRLSENDIGPGRLHYLRAALG